jgi:hypothetical protein
MSCGKLCRQCCFQSSKHVYNGSLTPSSLDEWTYWMRNVEWEKEVYMGMIAGLHFKNNKSNPIITTVSIQIHFQAMGSLLF